MMKDIKSAIARNISELRRANGMTQLELAEKLNYSDKAISKWERGESVPDVATLVEIAEIFSVSLDYIVRDIHVRHEGETEEEKILREKAQKSSDNTHKAILGICVQCVFFVAMLLFVCTSLIFKDFNSEWLFFVYAVPIASIIWLIFNTIWFNPRLNYVIISVMVWSILACIHTTALVCGANITLIYLLGIPAEAIIIMWSAIAKKPKS